jgi:predicted DNA binding protein
MRHLRATVEIAEAAAPPFFALLAHSDEITETRVLDWNGKSDAGETALLAIRGDASAFAAAASDVPGVESVALSPGDPWTDALVDLDLSAMAVFAAIDRAQSRRGLVVRTPVVYRDGAVNVRVAGEAGPLQAALDEAGGAADVRVDEVGTVQGGPDRPTAALSERQREAVAVAEALGYYDYPREATIADVAAELDCAAETAGEHLQRAEAKLVAAVTDRFGPHL